MNAEMNQMAVLSEQLKRKWAPVIEHTELPAIEDNHKKAVTAILLENQERAMRQQAMSESGFLTEAPLNNFGGSAGVGSTTAGLGATAGSAAGSGGGNAANPFTYVDPVLISLVRRAMPNLMAYDICGVQPMTGPSGLIFAMRSKYAEQEGNEAFYQEADPSYSGDGTAAAAANPGFLYDLGVTGAGRDDLSDPSDVITSETTPLFGGTSNTHFSADPNEQGTGRGGDTQTAETLGFSSTDTTRGDTNQAPGTLGIGADNHFREMAFTIERVVVEAKTRALKGEYSMELAQDLRAVHGLDAETELANILSTEILAEINREIVRTIYNVAVRGAQHGTRQPGFFDLDYDANGRWSVEKWKGLLFQIEREANQIAKETRRGKGNIIITSSDVASALQMAGVLDYAPALKAMNNLNVDDTGNTFAGVLNGKYKVYVDPYAGNIGTGASSQNFFVVGYKGSTSYDAGMFYCPYVPLQMVRAIGEDTFQPKIGFKTRYGLVANPFSEGFDAGHGRLKSASNVYYRGVVIKNIF